MGAPPLKSDLYYNTRTNQFEKVKPKIPAVEISSAQESAITEPEIPESPQKEKIIEFLYELFQDSETLYEPGYEPPLESAP